MKRLLPLLLLALPAFSGTGQSLRLNGAQQVYNTSVTAQPVNGPCRIEFQVKFGAITGAPATAYVNTCGLVVGWFNQSLAMQPQALTGSTCCTYMDLSAAPSSVAFLRYQQIPSGAGGSWEQAAWDENGVLLACTRTPYTGTAGSYSNLVQLNSSGSLNLDWGFFRIFTTTVSNTCGQTPVFADTGNLLEWKFNGNLNDSSGNGFTATSSAGTPASSCGPAPCYIATVGQPFVKAIAYSTLKATVPFWAFNDTRYAALSIPPWNTNGTDQVDCTDSYSQDETSSAVTCAWTQTGSTPSVLTFLTPSSTTSVVTGAIPTNVSSITDYTVALGVTDVSSNMASTSLEVGAVAEDPNGVVQQFDAHATEIFGPMVAFGRNLWAYDDERQLKSVVAQPAYQAVQMDTTWQTVNTSGTISYTFSGKGFGNGTCTTLSSAITSATQTTIAVADATCLSLAGLPGEPTWIMVGTGLPPSTGAPTAELIRICSTSATSGPATLTTCFDGRGLSSNSNNYAFSSATTWSSGAFVGEFRIQGTSTLFSTDAARAICPAGVPGPPGLVAYSTGTVTLSTTTVTASSGTPFTAGNGVKVGGYIRVTATHDGGTAFITWRQITAIPDSTHLTVDHAFPATTDATAFNYKITSVGGTPTDPTGMFMDLEFNAPDRIGTHLARLLFTPFGCESETAMFSVASRDISAINTTVMSGLHYSYGHFLWAYSAFGPDFYGTGLDARNFYYRSGLTSAFTFANTIDEVYAVSPEIAEGYIGGSPLIYGGGVIGSLVDLVLNSSTVLTWKNMEYLATVGEIGPLTCNVLDTREGSYRASWLVFAANYSTDSTNRTAYKNALGLSSPSVLSREQLCRRNASDGYVGSEVNSYYNTDDHSAQLALPLVLTNGSTAVTGSGFTNGGGSAIYCGGVDTGTISVVNGSSTATLISGTLTQQTKIYITDTTSSPLYEGVYAYSLISGSSWQLAGQWPGATGTFNFMSEGNTGVVGLIGDNFSSIWTDVNDNVTSNQAQDKVWACKFNSSSSLTLNRPWDGPSSDVSHTFFMWNYLGPEAQQEPFMIGMKANEERWASHNDDPTIAAGFAALLPQIGEWQNTYGNDPLNTKGMFYIAVAQGCLPATVVAVGSYPTIHGGGCGSGLGNIPASRTLSAEGGEAMLGYYNTECALGTSQCNAARAVVDTFYGAIFGAAGYCASAIASTCDGLTADSLSDTNMSTFKYPGFFFGMGGFFTNAWPALRNPPASGGGSVSGGNTVSGGKTVRN